MHWFCRIEVVWEGVLPVPGVVLIGPLGVQHQGDRAGAGGGVPPVVLLLRLEGFHWKPTGLKKIFLLLILPLILLLSCHFRAGSVQVGSAS